jgi:hypothetical protein
VFSTRTNGLLQSQLSDKDWITRCRRTFEFDKIGNLAMRDCFTCKERRYRRDGRKIALDDLKNNMLETERETPSQQRR